MSLTSKVISMAIKKFPSVVRGGRKIISKTDTTIDKYVLSTAKKRLSKDLLSDTGFKRYQSNQIFSHNKKIKQLNKEREYLISEYKNIDKATAGQDPHLKLLKRQIRDAEDTIKREVEGIAYTDNPHFKDIYNEIVKHKIKYTPAEFAKNLKSQRSLKKGTKIGGDYAHPKFAPGGMDRRLREADEYTSPFRSSRNPDLYAFLDGKGYKKVDAKGILGKVRINKDYGPKERISTGVHEYKHSVQEALKGYRDKTRSLIPSVNVSGQKEYALVAKREGLYREAVNTRNLTKAEDELFQGWVGYSKYITKPHEVSARLSEHRAGSKVAHKIAERYYKMSNKNKILADKAGYQPPSYYSDLMDIFGSKNKMDKALKEAWAVAPISLMGMADKE